MNPSKYIIDNILDEDEENTDEYAGSNSYKEHHHFTGTKLSE
jgi:hypothetical protein